MNELEQYVESFKNGNLEVFTFLYEHSYKRLYYVLRKVLNYENEIDDILQEKLIKLTRKYNLKRQFTMK